jgi:hypothetical protein
MTKKKVVYTSAEIPHLWVHQKVTEARNRQGNLYFVGDTIYSYGSHFPIAKLVTRKGKTVVLFTTREYSNMTSQHKYAVRDACRHLTIFEVPVFGRHREVFQDYKETCHEMIEYVRQAKHGSKAYYRLNTVGTMIQEFNSYAEFFELKVRMTYPEDWSELRKRARELLKRYDVLNAEREKVKAERRKLEEELRRKKFEELLPMWEKCEIGTNLLPQHATIFLRLRRDQARVETSQGAQVPIAYVRAIWKLITNCRNIGKPMSQVEVDATGQKDLERFYKVDRIDVDGSLHIGCHHILWEQIERLARRLNWISDDTQRTPATAAA